MAWGITAGHRLQPSRNTALYFYRRSHACCAHGRKTRVGSRLEAAETRQEVQSREGPRQHCAPLGWDALEESKSVFHYVHEFLSTLWCRHIFFRKKEERKYFHRAQTRSLIKRRFLLSFGVFTVRLAGNWVLLELIRQRRLELPTGRREDCPSSLLCLAFLLFFSWK